MSGVTAGIVGAVIGGAAGFGLRILLARLRRGIRLRPGILEFFAALVTAMGATASAGTPRFGIVLVAGLLTVLLTPVDAVYHRLPDAITLPAIPVAAVTVLATFLAVPGSGSLFTAAACGVGVWAAFAALAHFSPRSMGWGDVKLVPSLGLLTGYFGVVTTVMGVLMAFVLGALVALYGLIARRLTLTSAIPFGPFLLLGAWIVLTFPGLVAAVS